MLKPERDKEITVCVLACVQRNTNGASKTHARRHQKEMLKKQEAREWWRRSGREAKESPGRSPHALRHRSASKLKKEKSIHETSRIDEKWRVATKRSISV